MPSRSRLVSFTAIGLGLCVALSATAQQAASPVVKTAMPAASVEKLTTTAREEIVEKLAAGIEEGYVLEEKGGDLAAQLRRMGSDGRFTDDDPKKLAEALGNALREISGDLHLRVTFGSIGEAMGAPRRRMVRIGGGAPGTQGAPAAGAAPGASQAQPGAPAGGPRMIRRMGNPGELAEMFNELSGRFPDNYRSKILPGNVGLLEVDILFPPHDRLDAAMRELAGTDALILDLRSCPGGTNLTALPLESVFFAEPTHLRTMADRKQGPQRIESLEETPGRVKYLDRPVYILISSNTGSACEEVAWTLKYHDKAILVGETTAGAGHGITGTVDLGHGLTATVPSLRPIHPHIEGGWEGIGVPPEVTVASRRAADEAHLMALMAIMENAEGAELSRLESLYTKTAMEIGRRASNYVDQDRSLRGYSASFEEGRRLHVKDGELYYTAEGRRRGPLVPLDAQDTFELSSGMRRMILEVQRGDDGEIEGLAISTAGSEEWKRFARVPAL